MNRRMIFYMTGRAVQLEAALLLLPLVTALIYGESSAAAFAISIAAAGLLGTLLTLSAKPESTHIYTREGYILVSLVWVAFSAIGALPFVLSGEIPNYIDALFETVSGFTTTGASVVPDVETMSHGILFWRSFTHWIGGMGILVFVVMLGTKTDDNSLHILRAEMPGPTVDKLVPRAKDTARALYIMYLGMTVAELLLLLAGGMNFFESLLHTFGTAGTGGFGVKADSIAGYNGYLQWVITIFMVLFGVNFNLYFYMLRGKVKTALRSEELRVFLLVVLASTGLIAVNIRGLYGSVEETVRTAAFQVATIISITGYATTDFNLWPELSKTILLVLMFFGGCAGSTAGGIKISRVVVLAKSAVAEIRRLVHPRSVNTVRMDGRSLQETVVNGVTRYFAFFMLLFTVTMLLIAPDSPDMETALTATAACINNIGPGFSAVGPAANFAFFNPFSKLVLTFAMLLGRLEIYPLIITLSLLDKRR